MNIPQDTPRGKWLALAAAFLGWGFDGFEMGLFPLVARPAVLDLLGNVDDDVVGYWMGMATASFLVGAATGGVLFGWIGDRFGRVRAMSISVVTYSAFSGLCGLAQSPGQIAALRFLSALGMGGEWSLGVALIMEIWPDKSRAFLAGLIGAAANVGFLLVGVIGGALAPHLSWRWILVLGAVPALLAFFIQLFVPESARWKQEHAKGTVSHWATRDLLGVGVGLFGIFALLYLWSQELPLGVRILGSLAALAVVTLGYLYPAFRYLGRQGTSQTHEGKPLARMLLGACLGGVALLATWAVIQWAPTWADRLTADQGPAARAAARGATQSWSACGAIFGTLAGAFLGNLLGRRPTYFFLCVGSLASCLFFYQMNTEYNTQFLVSIFVAGGFTASFYGWLPLYLPELFAAGIRATGQGFSFNFGRVIAAVGALQTGFLMKQVFHNDFATACSVMSLIYIVGMLIIWLAPETRGKPLPE